MTKEQKHITQVFIDPSVLAGPNGANFAIKVTGDIIRANQKSLGLGSVAPMVPVAVEEVRELLQESKPREQDIAQTPRKNPFFVVK
jgi:hypothetical protein